MEQIKVKCLEDHRGGRESTFSAEMEYDLIDNTVLNRKPTECGFASHTWTCDLASQYIENNYGVKYTVAWIHKILKRNNLSFKRAQAKPTKADKQEQEKFKKMSGILDSLESSDDIVVYALDETKVAIESDNRRSWSLVGVPPMLECNGSRKGMP